MTSLGRVLKIFRRECPVTVLGPFSRAVIWVQGCNLACPQCIVPESWALDAGEAVTVVSLAEWVLTQPQIEGLTISGGEPFLQAASLCYLIDHIKSQRDLGVLCYTGYTHSHLSSRGTADQKALLSRLDLLIDGAYIAGQHKSLLWRGSANQNILQLSDRYAAYLEKSLAADGDLSVGIEVTLDEQGGIGYAGVPAIPQFRENFIKGMKARGIRLALQLEQKVDEERKVV
jgi:anaerobic ribonucleoside-triphosphate reductase activating protein